MNDTRNETYQPDFTGPPVRRDSRSSRSPVRREAPYETFRNNAAMLQKAAVLLPQLKRQLVYANKALALAEDRIDSVEARARQVALRNQALGAENTTLRVELAKKEGLEADLERARAMLAEANTAKQGAEQELNQHLSQCGQRGWNELDQLSDTVLGAVAEAELETE